MLFYRIFLNYDVSASNAHLNRVTYKLIGNNNKLLESSDEER